jgi:hypothetical protein
MKILLYQTNKGALYEYLSGNYPHKLSASQFVRLIRDGHEFTEGVRGTIGDMAVSIPYLRPFVLLYDLTRTTRVADPSLLGAMVAGDRKAFINMLRQQIFFTRDQVARIREIPEFFEDFFDIIDAVLRVDAIKAPVPRYIEIALRETPILPLDVMMERNEWLRVRLIDAKTAVETCMLVLLSPVTAEAGIKRLVGQGHRGLYPIWGRIGFFLIEPGSFKLPDLLPRRSKRRVDAAESDSKRIR